MSFPPRTWAGGGIAFKDTEGDLQEGTVKRTLWTGNTKATLNGVA